LALYHWPPQEPALTRIETAAARPPRDRRLKRFLILDTIGSIILIPMAAFWGVMSVMSTTTTADARWANAYALMNLSLPVAMLVCLVAAWTAWAVRRHRAGWIIALTPIAWVAVSVVMMMNWPAT
jgi:uncharacterized membrane protein YdbT with pleckstrin-like domain